MLGADLSYLDGSKKGASRAEIEVELVLEVAVADSGELSAYGPVVHAVKVLNGAVSGDVKAVVSISGDLAGEVGLDLLGVLNDEIVDYTVEGIGNAIDVVLLGALDLKTVKPAVFGLNGSVVIDLGDLVELVPVTDVILDHIVLYVELYGLAAIERPTGGSAVSVLGAVFLVVSVDSILGILAVVEVNVDEGKGEGGRIEIRAGNILVVSSPDDEGTAVSVVPLGVVGLEVILEVADALEHVDDESVEYELHSLGTGKSLVEVCALKSGAVAVSAIAELNVSGVEGYLGLPVGAGVVVLLAGNYVAGYRIVVLDVGEAEVESVEKDLLELITGDLAIRVELVVALAVEDALGSGVGDVLGSPHRLSNVVEAGCGSELLRYVLTEEKIADDLRSLSAGQSPVDLDLSLGHTFDDAKAEVHVDGLSIRRGFGCLSVLIVGKVVNRLSNVSGRGKSESANYHDESQNQAQGLFQGLHVVFPPYKNKLLHLVYM